MDWNKVKSFFSFEGLFHFKDVIIVSIEAAAIIVTSLKIFPSLSKNHPAAIGVCWIIFITVVWTFYILYRFSHQKRNFSVVKDSLTAKNEELEKERNELKKENIKYERQSRYATALKKINFGYAGTHGILRDEQSRLILSFDEKSCTDTILLEEKLRSLTSTLKLIRVDLQKLCDSIVDSLNHITGSPNAAVCIKIFRSEDPSDKGGCSVRTLIRDSYSDLERGHERETKVIHWVSQNTAYLDIYNRLDMKNNRCFFSNCLPMLDVYSNTSFQIYGTPSIRPASTGATREEIIKAWTLPYNSTIVAPLCPIYTSNKAKDDIIGYLAVDSSDMDVFLEKIEPILVEGLSDGMYNPVKMALQIMDKGVKLEKRIAELKK